MQIRLKSLATRTIVCVLLATPLSGTLVSGQGTHEKFASEVGTGNIESDSTITSRSELQRELLSEALVEWKQEFCLPDGSFDERDPKKVGRGITLLQSLAHFAEKANLPELPLGFAAQNPNSHPNWVFRNVYYRMVARHLENDRPDLALEVTRRPDKRYADYIVAKEHQLLPRIVTWYAKRGEFDKAMEIARHVKPETPIKPDGNYSGSQRFRINLDRRIAIEMLMQDPSRANEFAKRVLPGKKYQELSGYILDRYKYDFDTGVVLANKLPTSSRNVYKAKSAFWIAATGKHKRNDGETDPDLKLCERIIDYAINVDREKFVEYFLGNSPYAGPAWARSEIPEAAQLLFKKSVSLYDDDSFALLDTENQLPLVAMMFYFGQEEPALRWEKIYEDKRLENGEDDGFMSYVYTYRDSSVHRVRQLVDQGEWQSAQQIADSISNEKARLYVQSQLLESMYDRAAAAKDVQAIEKINELATEYYDWTVDPTSEFAIYSGSDRRQEEMLGLLRSDEDRVPDYALYHLARIDFLKDSGMNAKIRFNEIKGKSYAAKNLFISLSKLRGMQFALESLWSLELQPTPLQVALDDIHTRLIFHHETTDRIEFLEFLADHQIEFQFKTWPDRRPNYADKATEDQLLRMVELAPHTRYLRQALAIQDARRANIKRFLEITREEINSPTYPHLGFRTDYWYFDELPDLTPDQFEAIAQFVRITEDAEVRSKLTGELVKLHAKAGDVESAKDLLTQATSGEQRCKWLIHIAANSIGK